MTLPPDLLNQRTTARPALRAGSPLSATQPDSTGPDVVAPPAAGRAPSREPDADEPSASVARRRMSLEQSRTGFRRVPNAAEIARRRLLLLWTKWLLPAGALLLLASIAAWPEIDRSMHAARIGLKVAHLRMDSGRMLGARYRGLDGRDRPYMITADEAQQASPGKAASNGGDRINLTRPVADTLSQGGSWVRISGREGVYLQHGQLLDVSHDVMLYRDDGIMMTSPAADIDLKRGIIASNDWVHAEGPFGVLDAQAYLLSQRDGLAQFRGPGRLVLNEDRITRPTAPSPSPGTAPEPTPESASGAHR